MDGRPRRPAPLEEVVLVIWTLKCQTCDNVLGTAVEAKHVELLCSRCHHTTTFTTYDHHGNPMLSTIHVPTQHQSSRERKPDFDRMMRSNRGVDPKRC
jgi:phage FluMu protein Com